MTPKLTATQVTTDQALEALQREASKQVQGGLEAEEAADLKVWVMPGIWDFTVADIKTRV
jgi:hypothetical protein